MCDFRVINKELQEKLKSIKLLTKKKKEIRNTNIYDENTRNKMCININEQIVTSGKELTNIIQAYTSKGLEQ